LSQLLHCVVFLLAPAPNTIYTLSLHDALPISQTANFLPKPPHREPLPALNTQFSRVCYCSGFPTCWQCVCLTCLVWQYSYRAKRSEEHTSELQSRFDLVCRLLLDKKESYDATR